VKVEFSDEAKTQVRRIDSWWRANRPSSPDLFTRELELASLTLEDTPGLGVRYDRKPGVRRLLLRRTHYHLYFVEEAERVHVVAVWSAFHERAPEL
jgi:plasmid stabilization system protein ParE